MGKKAAEMLKEAQKHAGNVKAQAAKLVEAAKKKAAPHVDALKEKLDEASKKAGSALQDVKKAAEGAKDMAMKHGAPEEKFLLIPDDDELDAPKVGKSALLYYGGLASLSLVSLAFLGFTAHRLRQRARNVALSVEEEPLYDCEVQE